MARACFRPRDFRYSLPIQCGATKESLEQAEKIENEIELLINEDDPELSRLRTKKEVEEQWLNRIEK